MTKEIYDKSVDVLLDAYNENKLFHVFCSACAVGNLVAAANNYIPAQSDEFSCGTRPHWADVFSTGGTLGQLFRPEQYKGIAKKQIDSTGISLNELMEIEESFESCDYDTNNEKRGQYQGLVAVLNVMKDMVEEEVPHIENIERLESIHEKLTVCQK